MQLTFMDELLAKITAILPQDMSGLKQDTCNNIRLVLQSMFEKMDLVTREDFEVQKTILLRAQQQIQHLTQQVQHLETMLNHKP